MNVETIILAGGEGIRLRPLTQSRPKPLMPLLDEPVAGYMLKLLHRHGVGSAVMTLRSGAQQLRAAFGDGSGYSLALRYAQEDKPLGTAGSVKAAVQGGGTLLVVSGDILTDCDLNAMYMHHRNTGALATVALTAVEDARPYGLCETDEQGRILRFTEKPAAAEALPGLVNAGIYLLERQVLQRIPPNGPWDFGRDVFPDMAAEGLLQGVLLRGYWRDIGTPACYARAQDDLLRGRVGLPVHGRRVGQAILAPGAQVDARARITGRCYVGEGAVIGPGAWVGPGTVLCSGAYVGSGVQVSHACLWPGVRVEGRAVVRETLLLHGGGIAPYPGAEGAKKEKYLIKKEG